MRERRTTPTALVGTMVLALVSCGGDNPSAPPAGGGASRPSGESTASYQTYTDSEFGFSIKYPQDWEKLERQFGTTVLFRSPKEDKSDPFQENVNVAVETLPSDSITLDQYYDAALPQVEKVITDFDLSSSDSFNRSGRSWRRIVYTGRQGQFDLRFQQDFTVMGARAYVLTFVAERDRFSEFLPTAEAIAGSFQVS
jgi:PsbP-like protein